MKKLLLTIILMSGYISVFTQEEMPEIWQTKLEHKISYSGTGLEDRGYSYAASDKEMTVFKNADGKVLWTKAFKELAPKLSKIDELIPFWEGNTVFLFDRKMGKDQIACIDLEKGNFLWSTDKYQDVNEDVVRYIPEEEGFAISLKKSLVFIKMRTGEEIWQTDKFKGVVGKYVYDKSERSMVMVNFVPGGIAALFTGFKNQLAKINVQNGDIIWENTYTGRAERKVWTREFVFDLDVEDDKVILRINGYQVYDYKTGASLWSAAFDFVPDGVVPKPAGTIKFGAYGTVAEPVTVGEDLYILDMSNKKNQFVKKYDRNTGKLIWTSKEIKDARVIPGMYIVGDKVLMQIGGRVEIQYYRSYKSGDYIIYEWGRKFPEVKPFGIQAFNTSDGTLAWESERFKKGITNALMLGDQFVVSSGKALYSIDINTGAEKYEVPVSKGGVGQAEIILKFKEDVIVVVGEKGISNFNAKTGDVLCKGDYKSASLHDRVDDLLIMKTDKADLAAFDLNTCTYKEYKAKTGARTDMTLDGNFVYVYEKNTVTKVSTGKK